MILLTERHVSVSHCSPSELTHFPLIDSGAGTFFSTNRMQMCSFTRSAVTIIKLSKFSGDNFPQWCQPPRPAKLAASTSLTQISEE